MDQQYESSDFNQPSDQPNEAITANQDDRYQKIAETAYFIAEQRGFEGGSPMDDWLQAEEKVDSLQQESHPEH